MTLNELNKVLQTLLKMEFNVGETMKVLTYNINIFWSWGVSKKYNIENKGLLLKVSGHHHKGWVFITLDWSDTYTVHIISNKGEVLQTYEMVYFDDLVEIIDNRIERIPEYIR